MDRDDVLVAITRLETTQSYQIEILEEMRSTVKTLAELPHRVAALEEINTKKANRKAAVIKWGAGIAASVVAALIVVFLGFK